MTQNKTETVYIHIYQSGISSFTKLPMFTAIGLHRQYTQEEWDKEFLYLGVLMEVFSHDVDYILEDAINSEVDKLKAEMKRVDANAAKKKADLQYEINELLMLGVAEQ